MNAPLTSHAVIKKRYETTCQILEKTLDDQYTACKKNLGEVIAALEDLIGSQSKQLAAYKQEICDKDDHIRGLQYEIAGLKQRMLRVAEMAGTTGNERDEGETSCNSHYNGESSVNINTITRPRTEMLRGTKSDLRFRQEKELPRRPTVDVTATIHELDDLVDGFGFRPGGNSHAVIDFEQNGGSPSSTYASSQIGSTTKSYRLKPVDEHGVLVPNDDLNDLALHDFNPTMIERVRTGSVLALPLRPVSLGVSENAHPLRRESPSRAVSSDYPRGRNRIPLVVSPTTTTTTTTTAVFPVFARKETFFERFKPARLRVTEPQPTPEPLEPDSVVRARVRAEAERRKAANFDSRDRVKKSDIIHTVVLLPPRSSEIQPMEPKTKFGVIAEAGFEKPELGLKRIESDSSKSTGRSLKHVVKGLKSDIWGKGSGRKESKKSSPSVKSEEPTTDSDDSSFW
ncbi:hypothetical protein Q9L58_006130 [Maublancomyces gigas]|uniref:Uncharacterized protein n=1 Tax=Discina gigas TaxID=1032678 RepID=A0ABR3GGF4_9PEZI